MEKTVANRIAFAQTRDLLLEGQNVRICVQGQSMLPFFRSGSVITLRPLRHGDLRRGAVVMAETVQGNFVVHRIIRGDSGRGHAARRRQPYHGNDAPGQGLRSCGL